MNVGSLIGIFASSSNTVSIMSVMNLYIIVAIMSIFLSLPRITEAVLLWCLAMLSSTRSPSLVSSSSFAIFSISLDFASILIKKTLSVYYIAPASGYRRIYGDTSVFG